MVNVASYKSIQEFFCALNFAKKFLINQEKPLRTFVKRLILKTRLKFQVNQRIFIQVMFPIEMKSIVLRKGV